MRAVGEIRLATQLVLDGIGFAGVRVGSDVGEPRRRQHSDRRSEVRQRMRNHA